ncbi:MAG: M20/M25/M40 family metallo-hydrolase [Candidatus Thermoplasmatota archaeon]|nr:M20/M25/M40 family metallo-hydrolase [Candidatus Thermoplasmatota archaeon]
MKNDRAKEILTDLVLLKSTSEDDSRQIVEYVSSKLSKLGLEPRYHGDKDHPAIVAQFGQNGVALSGHLDTVPHGTNWKFEDGEFANGKLYGRGSCDMKGGCTAMLLAAEDLVAANVPFSLCFTTDEETTMIGAEAAAKDPALKNAPAIVVAEATAFDIVVKEKGLLHFSLSTKGVSTHASMPELGDNAIVKLLRILGKTEDLQRIPKNPVNELTMCVDTIQGGTRINVIPDSCTAEIDIRYPPDLTTKKVLTLIKDRIGDHGYEIKILHELDPVETDTRLPAVQTLTEVVGPAARITAVPYATEMVMFKNSNKALMVCGPGDPKICHCNDEWIDVGQIAKAVDIYIEYCSRMATS